MRRKGTPIEQYRSDLDFGVPFISKFIEVSYRLDLLLKMKIYLVYYIVMLKLVYKDYKSLIYK